VTVTTPPPQHLTQEQLANALGVTTRTLRRWSALGFPGLQPRRLNARIITYVVDDLQALADALAARRRPPDVVPPVEPTPPALPVAEPVQPGKPTPRPLSLVERGVLATLAGRPRQGTALALLLAKRTATPPRATWKALARLTRHGLLDDLVDSSGKYRLTAAGRKALAATAGRNDS